MHTRMEKIFAIISESLMMFSDKMHTIFLLFCKSFIRKKILHASSLIRNAYD